ncbi:chitinase 10 [Panicum miliaceum]|uniref:chitinase n=1 Tax=Panicum miliaceum TaxID=4540 RepID=A0A3L6SS69_PANMI|nr:chitinase 10 [Panicum miliaceum]
MHHPFPPPPPSPSLPKCSCPLAAVFLVRVAPRSWGCSIVAARSVARFTTARCFHQRLWEPELVLVSAQLPVLPWEAVDLGHRATHYGALVVAVAAFLVASGGIAGVAEARYYGPGRCSPVAELVSEQLYNSLFLHKDDPACPAKGFYTYASFVNAARTFPRFAATGDLSIRKRELAAFFAQISHETTGGWATAPDGEYSWGLCFKEEISPASDYCDATDAQWPCYPGRSYHGRGPIQLSWNFNYGPAGRALGFDGLRNP